MIKSELVPLTEKENDQLRRWFEEGSIEILFKCVEDEIDHTLLLHADRSLEARDYPNVAADCDGLIKRASDLKLFLSFLREYGKTRTFKKLVIT